MHPPVGLSLCLSAALLLGSCSQERFAGQIGPSADCLAHAAFFGERVRFAVFGDYGGDDANEQAVADLVHQLDPDIVLTTGDNIYDSTDYDRHVGQYYSRYIGGYEGAYGPGAEVNRFFPTLGNHDINDGGLQNYLAFFDLPGVPCNTSGTEQYYDFVAGPVHFFALFSDDPTDLLGGSLSRSPQGVWLRSQLEVSNARWKVVYMHHPPYSSSTSHGSEPAMQWPFEAWGASAVFAGHDHTYERIIRDDNRDGVPCPYFVSGLGGKSLYSFPPDDEVVDGSAARYNGTYGTLFVEATPEAMVFRFHSVNPAHGTDGVVDEYFLTNSAVP